MAQSGTQGSGGESCSNGMSENDETDASGTYVITQKIAQLKKDKDAMEAKYQSQKVTIDEQIMKISNLNKKLVKKQQNEEKGMQKKKKKLYIEAPRPTLENSSSYEGTAAENRKYLKN